VRFDDRSAASDMTNLNSFKAYDVGSDPDEINESLATTSAARIAVRAATARRGWL